jgi:hypothetical protein
MYDFRFFLEEQANNVHRSRWIVHSACFRFSMASQIDHFTGDSLVMEELPQRSETKRNAPVWRRIWTQQKHSHFGF